jgi:hypothetical protein
MGKMPLRKTAVLAPALVCVSGLAAVANASEVTYDFTSGYVTLSAVSGGVDYLAAGQELPLTGTQVSFDASAIKLDSFQFTAGPTTMALQGALTGVNLTVNSLLVVPDVSYSSSGSGSNPYDFTAGSIDASGMYSLAGAVTRAATSFSATNPTLSGQITLGGMDSLQLTGVTLGVFTVAGHTVTLKGDVVFDGVAPVPLPAAVWLFGSGLSLFGVPFMRRRRAA